MTRLYFAAFVAVLTFAGSAARANALVWETQTIRATARPDQSDVLAVFRFTNHSGKKVTLTSIDTSCGCTIASSPKLAYAPGEKGAVSALFEVGDNVGPHTVYITVATDEPNAEPTRLGLAVDIPESLRVEPRAVYWGVGSATQEKIITCSALPGHPITVQSVTSTDPTFVARVETLRAGETYAIHVLPKTTDHHSYSILHVNYTTSDHRAQTFNAYAQVKGL